jgi:hypothetical protein
MVKPLRVRIVLSPDNGSWIIEKMANRLAALTEKFGCIADIAPVPDPDADLNHWMSYAFANVGHTTPTSMLITHLDDPYKVALVRGELSGGVGVGICLSSHSRDMLVGEGIAAQSLAFVVPGHDFAPTPRRIVIGLTTRLYPDGRKREAMLLRLAKAMRLDAFRFEIFGQGWDDVISYLKASDAEIFYRPGTDDYVADYREMIDHVVGFDYYLYLGRDEGSLGTLDALAAGVKTIVTPQGFHVDLPHGITHAIWDDNELLAVFRMIARERQKRLDAVAAFTWDYYAQAHALIWRAIVEDRRDTIEVDLRALRSDAAGPATARSESWLATRLRYVSPYRVRSALSHIPVLRPIRNWLRRRH